MLAVIRRKVSKGESGLGFTRNNPFDGSGADTMVKRLGWLVGRAKELLRLQQERDLTRATGVERRETVREHLTRGLLRLFAGAGRSAARLDPAKAEAFALVKRRSAAIDFSTSARSLIDATRTHLDAVRQFGVEPGMIDDAVALIDEYDALALRAGEAKSGRIQARAEMFPVAAEIMDVLNRLDSLNRHRFANDPARLAAWKSALRDQGPLAGRREEPPAADPGVTSPPTGDTTRSA